FRWGGLPVGMLLLASTREDAFQPDAHRLLDMLANQAAELIGGLRRQLGEERQRLDAMLKSLADGVIMVDDDEQVAVINPAARRLLGIEDSEEVTTRYLKETLGFYPFELVKGWQASEGRSVREEVKLGDRLVHSIVSPVSQDGKVIGVAVVLRDVTEERRLLERKEEFISIVSHELRTPLTSIGGAIDLLLSNFAGPLNQKQKHYLGLARAGCEKMNMLVDELLDLRRLEQGRMKMDMRPMDLSGLVAQVAESFRAAAMNKGVRLGLAEAEQVQIMGDRNRLHQVLNNLLSNALKFVTEGGNIEVEVFTSPDMPGLVGVSVFNDGEEIPEKDHRRIFDKFEQAKNSRSGKVSGSGLGLAICKSIVEAHGGRIWVESGRGTGTRFIFTLPAHAGADKRPGTAGRPPPRFKGTPRLLVVDDDLAFTYVVKGYLMGCGFEVDVAHDGAAAVHLCREKKPELIIMDIRMPSPDGLDTVDALKHDPKTRNIPVLVVSGACDENSAAQAGTAGFMPKPLEMEELRNRIEQILLENASTAKRLNILVVDDDPAIRDICREVLEGQGFATLEASSGKDAVELARNNRVDAVLLDLMLPDFDGFQVTEMLRRLQNTEDVPIIFISARGQTSDKVRALRLGADDYVVKPFDAMELGARVEAVIKRKERETDASPTTRLPGSAALEREVGKRLAAGEKFYLCYLDLDNLKAYNDYYGYARADGVIRQTASIIRRAVETHGGQDDFLAHIAGDDFVLITGPERLESIAAEVIKNFDRVIPLFYEPEDQQRGFIEAMDRFGQMRRFGIMSISLAAVLVDPEKYSSHSEISEVAARLKLEAKKREGSVLVKE
ncbi:MAG: response regulator, partial [Deltaproteobacteria bacterium]